MTPEAASHVETIRTCLARMERNPDILRQYEVLQGGVSGSRTYRLALAAEDVILKATPADRGPYLVERARREAEFYRRLADLVPVQVPRPLAIVTDVLGTCLMLPCYQVCPPVPAWSVSEYLRVGEELGRFHAAFWDRIDRLAEFRWLRDPGPDATRRDVERAHGYWQELREIDRFRDVLPPRRHERIVYLLERIEEIERSIQSLPPTLCHGDFHAGNLLCDGHGGFLWTDWQEVGLGRGPEDLSLFIQRASFDGAVVPRDRILRAYQQSLTAAIGQSVSPVAIARVMDGAELRTRLLHWPAYLTQVPTETLTAIADRIDLLVRRLQMRV